jgi:hypothetical protein
MRCVHAVAARHRWSVGSTFDNDIGCIERDVLHGLPEAVAQQDVCCRDTLAWTAECVGESGNGGSAMLSGEGADIRSGCHPAFTLFLAGRWLRPSSVHCNREFRSHRLDFLSPAIACCRCTSLAGAEVFCVRLARFPSGRLKAVCRQCRQPELRLPRRNGAEARF